MDGAEELLAPVALTSEFWDAGPESDGRAEREELPRPVSPTDAYDAIDIEDLSAEWLARATEAPPADDAAPGFDTDDPAEVPADSLSMISQASRSAAAFDGEAPEDEEEYPER